LAVRKVRHALCSPYYDADAYSTIAAEFDVWTNQLRVLERIYQINDSILVLLNQQLE